MNFCLKTGKLGKLRQRVELNTSNQQIMFKNRDGIRSEPNI